MNSLQVVTPLQQHSRAALKSAVLRDLHTSALFLLGAAAAALLIPLGAGAGAGAAEMLAPGIWCAGAVLAFSLGVWLALDIVAANLKRAYAEIRASIKDSYCNAAALCVAAARQAAGRVAADDFFKLIFKLIFKLSLTAATSFSCSFAAKSRTRARTPDAGRVLSSVRDLFARTVAHLRAATSTLRAAGSGPYRAV